MLPLHSPSIPTHKNPKNIINGGHLQVNVSAAVEIHGSLGNSKNKSRKKYKAGQY